jgi:hypothetical protein
VPAPRPPLPRHKAHHLHPSAASPCAAEALPTGAQQRQPPWLPRARGLGSRQAHGLGVCVCMLAAWPRSVLSSPRCLLLQDLSTLEPAKLTPLSPEVISRQATINIGECHSLGEAGLLHQTSSSAALRWLCRQACSAPGLLSAAPAHEWRRAYRPAGAAAPWCVVADSPLLISLCRHHWSRGARQVHSGQGHIWRADGALALGAAAAAAAAAWAAAGQLAACLPACCCE